MHPRYSLRKWASVGDRIRPANLPNTTNIEIQHMTDLKNKDKLIKTILGATDTVRELIVIYLGVFVVQESR